MEHESPSPAIPAASALREQVRSLEQLLPFAPISVRSKVAPLLKALDAYVVATELRLIKLEVARQEVQR